MNRYYRYGINIVLNNKNTSYYLYNEEGKSAQQGWDSWWSSHNYWKHACLIYKDNKLYYWLRGGYHITLPIKTPNDSK